MALPPPPIQDDPSSYRWIEWYTRLNEFLNNQGVVPWSQVGKAGSNLADIATRNHANLQSIAGSSEGYHLSSSQYSSIASLSTGTFPIKTKAGDPTTSDLSAGFASVYKNTTSGVVKLWVNDGGVMKGVALA